MFEKITTVAGMLATTTKDTNAMQGQRANISAEFLAALSTQKYELKCHGFVNSPSASIPYKSGVLTTGQVYQNLTSSKAHFSRMQKSLEMQRIHPELFTFLKVHE